jgi:hypothetical protein
VRGAMPALDPSMLSRTAGLHSYDQESVYITAVVRAPLPLLKLETKRRGIDALVHELLQAVELRLAERHLLVRFVVDDLGTTVNPLPR